MAQRILGIDIGATEVKAVLAEVTWREVNVLGLYVEPVPAPEAVAHRLPPNEPDFPAAEPAEEAAEELVDESPEAAPPEPAETPPPWVFALADMIKKHDIDYQEIHTALPGPFATAHTLTLPFENRRRIEQVLPFELENLVPFELDTMHISFDVLGKAPEGGSQVLVCLTPKDKIAKFLKQLGQAGIDPRVVDFMPYSLYAAAKQALPEEMGACAVVDFGHTHTDLAVINQGELVTLRSIPRGGINLDEELAKALSIDVARAAATKLEKASVQTDDKVGQALRRGLQPLLVRLRQTLQGIRSNDGVAVTRLLVTGRGSLLRGLDDLLAEELSVEVQHLEPLPSDLPVSTPGDNELDQARFALANVLLYRGQGDLRAVRMNLRGGEFFYRRQRKAIQASLRGLIAAGVILGLLLGYNLVASHIQKKRYYNAISDQVVQIYLKAFPGAPPAQPVQQFRAQVSKTMAKYETVGFFGEGDLRAVDILKVLSQSIPPTLTVDFKKFSLKGDTLKLEGECPGFADIDRIEEALNKFSGFKHVKKESSQSVSEKVKFKFTISLAEKRQTSAVGPGGPGRAKTKRTSPTPVDL